MSEKRILLASLLKPVNDTRMYGKLALSLCKLPDVQVHVAGFSAPTPADAPANLHFHSIFSFKRLSLGRFAAQKLYWQLLQTIKPDLLIVCTHELLLASWWYCKSYSCKLIYDVQENYSLNLTAQDTYNPVFKRLLAKGVRSIENLLAPTLAHFFLAEQSYAQELSFIADRYTILENKFKPALNYSPKPTPAFIKPGPIKLLYSGTISGIYGIFEAIKFTTDWHQLNPQVTLTIIGYCAHEPTLLKLKQTIAGKPYITLIGGDHLVPHPEILQAIATHDIGLLPYQQNESTYRCIPTKLYEYMAYSLPIIVQYNKLWDDILSAHTAGLSINFNNYKIDTLESAIYNQPFYSNGVPQNVFWNSEEEKLVALVSQMLDTKS